MAYFRLIFWHISQSNFCKLLSGIIEKEDMGEVGRCRTDHKRVLNGVKKTCIFYVFIGWPGEKRNQKCKTTLSRQLQPKPFLIQSLVMEEI